MITAHEDAKPLEDVPDLIPARMLNEFAYCPASGLPGMGPGRVRRQSGDARRAGLATAGSISRLAASAGAARAAGKESGTEEARGEDADRAAKSRRSTRRSLMLSAPGEGLIAKMDLVDISAGDGDPGRLQAGPRARRARQRLGARAGAALCPRADPARERLPLRGRHPLFHRVAPPRVDPVRRAAGRPHAGADRRRCGRWPSRARSRRRWTTARNARDARWWASACPTKRGCCARAGATTAAATARSAA